MTRRRQEKEQQHLEEVKVKKYCVGNNLKELEEADSQIDADESKLDEILKKLDFENRDELKKRIMKIKLKLGLVSKQSLVRIYLL
jgi:adenylate cyclase class IV